MGWLVLRRGASWVWELGWMGVGGEDKEGAPSSRSAKNNRSEKGGWN
jgi:hypothetical protein